MIRVMDVDGMRNIFVTVTDHCLFPFAVPMCKPSIYTDFEEGQFFVIKACYWNEPCIPKK